MQSLTKIRDELSVGQEKLRLAVDTLDRELADLQSVCSGLDEEQSRLQKMLQSLEAAGEEVDPDEVLNDFSFRRLDDSSPDDSSTDNLSMDNSSLDNLSLDNLSLDNLSLDNSSPDKLSP
jgi:hypothetical protein